MYLPTNFSSALTLTILSTVFWGSWANSFKGTRNYPFALFYWDYIVGVVLCSFVFAFTLGSTGDAGEAFIENLHNADSINCVQALVAGAIFNVANLLLVAAVDIAGLSIAFPIAIGIAVVEGVVLSYALQPKGNLFYLAAGVVLAVAAVMFDARAYRLLKTRLTGTGASHDLIGQTKASSNNAASSRGIIISIASGVLMGAFAPFVTRAMTHGHALTPYGVAALFSVGALLCCLAANGYLMKHPIQGEPVSVSGYWHAGLTNHLLGVLGGIAWGIGGCLNFIAAGFVGVPISYAIGQSAPLIAASWGILVWREFDGAPKSAWVSLRWMYAFYLAAIGLIALAYNG